MGDGRDLPVITSLGLARGRCKYCEALIIWATVASRGPGIPAKSLPFNRQPIPRRSVRNDETGLVTEYWPVGELHLMTCLNDGQGPARRTRRRNRKTSRDRQGRLL